MKETTKNLLKDKKIILGLFIIAAIMFAIPSIGYILQNGTVLNFNEYFKFCLNDSNRVDQAMMYIAILVILTIGYFLILKNRKSLFKNVKQIYIYIDFN